MNMDNFKKDIDELIAQFTQVFFKFIFRAFLILNIMTLFLVVVNMLHCFQFKTNIALELFWNFLMLNIMSNFGMEPLKQKEYH